MADFPSLPLFTDAVTADCSHLTDEEFGRYMRILILMWRTPGCKIPDDPNWISKRMRVDALAYHVHMQTIMQEFCTLSDGYWTQKRLMKEYLYVQGVTEKRRNAAKKRWDTENKGNYTMQMDKQSICTAYAPTPTPTPTLKIEEKEPKGSTKKIEKPDDVSNQVWEDFLLLRKTKKAPVTETVLKTIRSEAAKIGWTIEQAMAEMSARGWQGFKASFIQRETLELKTSEKKNERTLTKDQRQIAALDRAEATIAGVARPSARIGLPKF